MEGAFLLRDMDSVSDSTTLLHAQSSSVFSDIMKNENNNTRQQADNSLQEGYGTVQGKFDIKIIDINASEATIETLKRLDVNREYTFKIFSHGYFLKTKGRVVWSFLTQSRENGDLLPVYRTGIKFMRGEKSLL
jgi:hypothetical protein